MLFTSDKRFCHWLILLLWLCLRVSSDDSSNNTYFPPDVKICSATDPHLDECFTHSANVMMKHLVPGIRNLNAVPMDPLSVPQLSLRRGNRLLPSLAFNVSDTVHAGWKDVVVTRSKINLKSQEFYFVLYFPHYHVRGLYEITGHVIGIPAEGSGDFDVYFSNSTCAVTVRGHLVERGGREFFVVDHARQESYFGKLKVDFRNLFNSTVLSAITNDLVNRNYRAFLDASTAAFDDVFSELYVALVQRIFDRVPYGAMFTDLP